MKNINRLKLELSNKAYFTDDEHAVFLEENGLVATEEYSKDLDESYLLQSVIAILQALNNNIEIFMNVSTEFVNTTSIVAQLSRQKSKIFIMN